MATDFLTGDDRFEIETARIEFHRETDRDPWLMNLEILAPSPPDPDEDSPRLELHRVPLEVADWRTLEGTTRRFADPTGDDHHEQNIYWGPHFENVGDLTVAFGRSSDDAIAVDVTGVSFRAIPGTGDEEKRRFHIRAQCTLVKPPPPEWTREPPLGRKTCHGCSRVSFDEVPQCPACGIEGWWNPSA